jgi:hypothetical protein
MFTDAVIYSIADFEYSKNFFKKDHTLNSLNSNEIKKMY